VKCKLDEGVGKNKKKKLSGEDKKCNLIFSGQKILAKKLFG
jgi:hypothetical protein